MSLSSSNVRLCLAMAFVSLPVWFCFPVNAEEQRTLEIELSGASSAGAAPEPQAQDDMAGTLLGGARSDFGDTGAVSPFSEAGTFYQVYPGIDLRCYTDEHHVEYEFRLGPGADPSLIRFKLSGVQFEMMTANGIIVYKGDGFEVYQRAPVALRVENDGRRRPVAAGSRLGGESDVSVVVSEVDDEHSEALNGSRFNVVPASSGAGGPDYDFFMSRFELTNTQWIRFLNDAQLNARNPRGENVFFDAAGNAWMNPAMHPDRDELFHVKAAHIRYDPDRAPGDRYTHFMDDHGRQPYADHPAVGISWYGALKYCNWLTLQAGRGMDERCYREGTNTYDWAPATATNWANGFFTAAERQTWLDFKGFRLPMSELYDPEGNAPTNAFNEFLKAGAWNGSTNVPYGHGRSTNVINAANTIETSMLLGTDTLPVGYFNGMNPLVNGRASRCDNGFGIHDLTGNVREWLNDPPKGGMADARSLAGGSFQDRQRPLAENVLVSPSNSGETSGFRPVTTFMPDSVTCVNILFCFHTTNSLPAEWRERFGITPPGTGEVAVPPPAVTPGSPAPGPVDELIPGVPPPDPVQPVEPPGIIYRDDEQPKPPPVVPVPPHGGGGGDGNIIPPPPTPTPPPELYILDVYSRNPDGGVSIPVSTADYYGRRDGDTAFSRQYEYGTTVTLTAPATVGTSVFQYWLRNGVQFETSRTITVQMLSDLQLTAVYVTPVPPVQRTLVVDSSPARNVPVVVSEVDNNGLQNGNTLMTRTYDNRTEVTVSVPSTFDGQTFVGWLRDGVLFSLNPTVSVTLLSDIRLTALYGPPPQPEQRRLVVASSNPGEGVPVSVSVPDVNGRQDGDSTFVRLYEYGQPVTLTAPPTAPNGNTFIGWRRNGVVFSYSETVTVTMISDLVLTAEYASPPPDVILTVGSVNPGSGVAIGIGTADLDGNSGGTTTFTRRYDQGATTTVTAPPTAPNGNVFNMWVLNGTPLSTNTTVSLSLLEDSELIAVYQRPPPPVEIWTLDVRSQNPGSGVGIYVSAADTNGNSSGSTSFTRSYENGTPVSLTAPTNAPGGQVFSHWLVDGVRYSDSETISLIMTGNRTVTAVYEDPVPPVRYLLTVQSQNPNSAIVVTVDPGDVNGQQNGSTTFTRLYEEGEVVTLTARNPAFPGSSNVLRQWLIDGTPVSTNATITVTMLHDTVVTAVYGPVIPATDHTLRVESRNPDGGVPISISVTDLNGEGSGSTAFDRLYSHGTPVTAVAPAIAPDGNRFEGWLLNGNLFSTNTTVTVSMLGDLTLTALYSPAPIQRTLTVNSQNPASGVPVTVSLPDNNSNQDGSTSFQRIYDDGATVTLTTPLIAPNGRDIFLHWLRDGVPVTTNNTVDVALYADVEMTAVYVQPSTFDLTVRSDNPDRNVTVAIGTPDVLGRTDGNTLFVRTYNPGETTTVTAPQVSPDGTVFQHWLRNGVMYSTNLTETVNMLADLELTAVYGPPAPVNRSLIVRSVNPDGGVPIEITPTDIHGRGDGDTSLLRIYPDGATVTVTAPATAPNGNVFNMWVLNGTPLSTNTTVSLMLLEDSELIAVYQPPSPPIDVWTLDVRSQNPGSGVGIYVSAADTNGNSSGSTAFTRSYEDGTPVSLTAPTNAPGGQIFSHWLVDGVRYSDSETISLIMTGNRTVTAVYEDPVPPVRYLLTVQSQNPDSAVEVTVAPADVNGQQNGTTPFTRLYEAGEVVTLTARNPAVPGASDEFRQWLLDGVPISTNATITVTMLRDTVVTAVYGPEIPATDHTLHVESRNPDGGVPISISVPDLNGQGSGSTAFDRLYSHGTNVTVTAPAIAPDGNSFEGWLLNGNLFSTNTTVTVSMLGDLTLTALYAPPPIVRTLTVNSQNPASGVPVTVSQPDNNSNQNGSTSFQRIYDDGATVTLTTPLIAPNGSDIFLHWLRDGVPVTTNNTVDVSLFADVEMTAVYVQPSTFNLTVRSDNPDRNVTVAIGTPDVLGRTDGNTLFVRTYNPGETTTVTAPQVSPDGTVFQHWLRNGVVFSTTLSLTVSMLADLELTAVYGPPSPFNHSLIVRSVNPDGGVPIEITPTDTRALGDGETSLLRIYPDGMAVTVTAPATAGTNTFRQWILNGLPISTNLTETILMTQDHELIAVYGPPVTPQQRVLTVDSRNPNSGVPVSVSTPDISGDTDGDTMFVRIYNFGESTTLVAPESSGTNNTTFLRWERDGVPYSENRTVTIDMFSDVRMTAVYGEVVRNVTLTVESQNPDSGVVISVAPGDLNSETTGTTTFQRLYEIGRTVTLSAPATADNRPFLHWLFDGVPLSTNPVVNVTMLDDRTMTAVYGDPLPPADVTLTVRAEGPDGDITTLIGATPDNNSNSGGSTTFTRVYDSGNLVTLTAPAVSNGLNFDHWVIGGVIYSNSPEVTLTLLANTTITAIYVQPVTSGSGL